MSYLIDSNILIDALRPDSEHHHISQVLLIDCGGRDRLIVNPVVWSEIAPSAPSREHLSEFCDDMLIERQPMEWDAAFLAGLAHARYRKAGGARERTLPDFLIGAHAQVGGHTLLTRDPDRYRAYFPDLAILTPTGAA